MKVGDLVRVLATWGGHPHGVSRHRDPHAVAAIGKNGLILRRVPVGYKDGLPVYDMSYRKCYEGHLSPDRWQVLLEGEVIELPEAGLETISESR